MQHVFGYIRVSTTRQGEHGVSLQEQRDAIERYAARENLEIVRWFEEQQTAARRGRPQFTTMLKLLGRREVSGVVIHKIDRSARNLRDWAELGELIDAGIKVHFANENLDLTSRGGRLTADIQAVVAADFVRNNREEVKKGLAGRLKQGLWPFGAPLGYLNRGKAQPKTVDPEKGPLVRRLFELYATAEFNLDTLTETAFEIGLTNFAGKPVSRDGIWTILTNPFYMGTLFVRRTGETYEGVHEPLIPPSLFRRVDDVLNGRSSPRVLKHDFTFRRTVSCGMCGRHLIGTLQKGHVYYRCHTKTCPTTSFREETLDEAFRVAFARIRFDQNFVSILRTVVLELRGDDGRFLASERGGVQLALQRCEDRLARLTDAFLDRTIDKELFDDRKGSLLAERAMLREQLARLSRDQRRINADIEELIQLAISLELQYDAALPGEKRRLLERITKSRCATGKRLEITLISTFEALAEASTSTSCAHEVDRHATILRVKEILGRAVGLPDMIWRLR